MMSIDLKRGLSIFVCGVMAMHFNPDAAGAPPARERGSLMLSDEAIKNALSGDREIALIQVEALKEEDPGTRGHKTVYKAAILMSTKGKAPPWHRLGFKRKETLWHWGPAFMDRGVYMAVMGEPGQKGRLPVWEENSTIKVPDEAGAEAFNAHKAVAEKFLAQLAILPDSTLRAAASGKLELAVLEINSGKEESEGEPPMPSTRYGVSTLKCLAGRVSGVFSLRLKGASPLKADRNYLVALAADRNEPQDAVAVEVYPGNMEKSIRIHMDKIRTFQKK